MGQSESATFDPHWLERKSIYNSSPGKILRDSRPYIALAKGSFFDATGGLEDGQFVTTDAGRR